MSGLGNLFFKRRSPRPTTLREFLFKHFPNVLTAEGRREQEIEDAEIRREAAARDLEWRRENRRAEFAPAIDLSAFAIQRKPGELDATDKQLAYLANLGVQDQQLLSLLGKSQASALIKFVLNQ